MKKLLLQAFKFFCVSGIGWIIDFCIFLTLTKLGVSEVIANIYSSFAGICFVYAVSTKKLFKNMNENFNLKKKFIVYILYQVVVVSISSFVIGGLNGLIIKNIDIKLIHDFSQLVAKIIVTPFTMVLNFIFMKFLIERV